MASETASSESPSSFIENLMNSRNRDISLFLPFILGVNFTRSVEETENQGTPRESPDRIILVNPITQGMVVIERGGSNSDNGSSELDSFFHDLFSGKSGRPPASKASIDSMATVEIAGGENDEGQCVICLEEWEAGEKAMEMPCQHRFHGECIKRWLKLHGSCPVCRYEMPMDEADDEKRRSGDGDGERRRGIWVSFTFGRDRRSDESNQNSSRDGSETDDSSTGHPEMQDQGMLSHYNLIYRRSLF